MAAKETGVCRALSLDKDIKDILFSLVAELRFHNAAVGWNDILTLSNKL